jgi:UDP-N-acetylmuramyl tripeptide synthase
MGAIAARTADLAILTSEDPRREDPGAIIDEIAAGCFAEGAVEGKNFVRVPDRRRAILFALKSARSGDSILILGKGHETTMAIKGIEHPWSDREVAKEEFSRMKRGAQRL